MKIVGLTGGIGSGKTTVAQMFGQLGIPVYNADDEAKGLMKRSKVIRRKLIDLFGEKAYLDNDLNRPYLAERIFNDKSLLEQMNAIVHPKVGTHFRRWANRQISPYVIKEAAILFESGSYKDCDLIITVRAPIELRINRVISRDNTSRARVNSILKNQWDDNRREALSHFVINNEKLENTREQVERIHRKILEKIS